MERSCKNCRPEHNLRVALEICIVEFAIAIMDEVGIKKEVWFSDELKGLRNSFAVTLLFDSSDVKSIWRLRETL